MCAGANDSFNTLKKPHLTPTIIINDAVTASKTQLNNLKKLITAKTPTVALIALPNLGTVPSFKGNKQAMQAATLSSTTFNKTLIDGAYKMAKAKAKANIVVIRIDKLLQYAQAHPKRLGFTNTNTPCIGTKTCTGFLFFDQVHPTQKGHKLIKDFIQYTLNYRNNTRVYNVLPQVMTLEKMQKTRILDDEILSQNLTLRRHWKVFQTLSGTREKRKQKSFDYDRKSYALQLGTVGALGQAWKGGLSVSAGFGDVKAQILKFNTRYVGLDAVAVWHHKGFYALMPLCPQVLVGINFTILSKGPFLYWKTKPKPTDMPSMLIQPLGSNLKEIM